MRRTLTIVAVIMAAIGGSARSQELPDSGRFVIDTVIVITENVFGSDEAG